MRDQLKPFFKRGFALHWLKPRSKAPVNPEWSTAKVPDWDEFRRRFAEGNNVGVRLGEFSRIGDLYLHVIDMDVRDADRVDEVHDALDELLPAWRTYPTVISGSGGESRHIYLLTDEAFRSRKLAMSEDHFVDAEGKRHRYWEIELFGTGKQVAFPPSIHPDTGNPYRWLREFDFDDLDMGVGPYVQADVVSKLTRRNKDSRDSEPDDLMAMVREDPVDDFDIDRARDNLEYFDSAYWDDRDSWLEAGMALHHQFRGSAEAFALWCEFSKGSKKFDERDQKVTWRAFGKRPGGITMRTILKRVADVRLQRDLADIGSDMDDDQEEDLIGSLPDDEPEPERKQNLEWVSLLDRNEEGALKSTLHNISLIVDNDPRTRGIVGFNKFTQQIRLIAQPKRKKKPERREKEPVQLDGWVWHVGDPVNGGQWLDAHDNALRGIIEAPRSQGGYGIKVTDRDLMASIDYSARANAFHPVQKYLKATKWDGTPRAEQLFIRYLGAPDRPYFRDIARLMLVAAVARAFEPGHKFDFAVIMEGHQGRRKSTFINTLAVSWFNELASDFSDDKVMVESMAGAWIIEIPELSGFQRHEVQSVKAFISRKVDKVRLAYARRVQEFPRQCIFIGSTNDKRYLKDETGGRRFWPVEVLADTIDTEHLGANVDQIWAEAYYLYRKMRTAKPHGDLPLYLRDPDSIAEAAGLQESRRVETADDSVLGQVQSWLATPVKGDGFDGEGEAGQLRNRVCLTQIAVECLGMKANTYIEKPALAQQLSRVMSRMPGWVSGERSNFDVYGRQRSYFRVD